MAADDLFLLPVRLSCAVEVRFSSRLAPGVPGKHEIAGGIGLSETGRRMGRQRWRAEEVNVMVVFSSCRAALREGFRILEFDRTQQLYLVVKDMARGGRMYRMIAFAKMDA